MNRRKMIYIGGIVLLLIITILTFKNFSNDNIDDSGKIKIVTTLFPLYDFAKEIGGENVEVALLLPPSVEPHSYEPKPSDIVKINEADIFIYTGEFMEPWAEDIIKGIGDRSVKIVDASTSVIMMEEKDQNHENEGTNTEEDEHNHIGIDPHIWLDFDNDKIIIENILQALVEVDSINQETYVKNAELYKARLAELDNKYRETLKECNKRRIIYGGHYAFGYMSRKYNFSYESAYGISPNSEPSIDDIVKLVEQVKDGNIKYIFSEELLSPKVTEMIGEETGAGILILSPAHNIKKEDYENGTSFISIMENNLSNLSIGLGCNK